MGKSNQTSRELMRYGNLSCKVYRSFHGGKMLTPKEIKEYDNLLPKYEQHLSEYGKKVDALKGIDKLPKTSRKTGDLIGLVNLVNQNLELIILGACLVRIKCVNLVSALMD